MNPTNQEIIRLIAEGKALKEVAATMHLSKRAIEERLKGMRKKHKCTSTLQLVVKILSNNIADAT
ncbi:MAG TPA: LuxR C-terminal-related transcriptional regulator [Flavisolibacter sp.]|nr:LuxR C-terminal-related transcriptional regulator [Flavisolibacter sp.]